MYAINFTSLGHWACVLSDNNLTVLMVEFVGLDPDEDSLIEEQAEVLNSLRKQRLIHMIERSRTAIQQKASDAANSATDIAKRILTTPDLIVWQINPEMTMVKYDNEVKPKRGCCG